jgi:phosphomannomutase/phosphoglucomutase
MYEGGVMIKPTIFRQYDIRGVWEKDLTPGVTELLGRGFASYLLKSVNKERAKISVGWDARLHSPAIKDSLTKGLTESGIDVIDL